MCAQYHGVSSRPKIKTMGMKCILSRQSLLLLPAFFVATVAALSQTPQEPSASVLLAPGPSKQQSAGSPAAAPSPIIARAQIAREGQKTIVQIAAPGHLVSSPTPLTNPDRLVLDFPGARVALQHWRVSSAVPPVRDVRAGQFTPNVARVVIDLERQAPYRVRSEANSITVEFDGAASAPARAPVVPVAPEGGAQHVASTPAAKPNVPALGAAAKTKAAPRSDSSPPHSAALAAPAASEGDVVPLENSFENGMLTFRARNEALGLVLKKIGDRAGVNIHLSQGLGKEPLSVEFRHYRLDEALRQMLTEYDAFFLYGPGKDGQAAALKAVWVYPAGRGQVPRPLPEISSTPAKKTVPTQRSSNSAPMQKSSNSVPRAEVSTGPGGSDSAAGALKGLEDSNDEVRERALFQALTTKAQIPSEMLVNLALADASVKVRVLALKALPLNPDWRWVAEYATRDSNQSVSQAAREFLAALELCKSVGSGVACPQSPPPQ